MREKYLLHCPGCGRPFPDRYTLDCPSGCDALLRTVYAEHRLTLRDLPGIFRYSSWLPIEGHLRIDAGPVSYESVGLARELGLSNLTITFSGYWPERGGRMETCSFKELEAQPTVLRLGEKGAGVIQVSSAGNTGRAFCQVSALTGAPVVVVVPASAADRLWTTVPSPNVCLITVEGDYSDSIAFGREVCSLPGIVPEGGAKNVARRDGMGTVMLDAALFSGRLPAPTSRRSGAEPVGSPRGRRRSGSSPTADSVPVSRPSTSPRTYPSSRWSGPGRRGGGISSRPRICPTPKPRSSGSPPTS